MQPTKHKFRHLIGKVLHDERSRTCYAIQVYDLTSIIDHHDQHLGDLRRSQPDVAEELTRMRRAILRLDRQLPAPPCCFAHGDFAHKNILRKSDRQARKADWDDWLRDHMAIAQARITAAGRRTGRSTRVYATG
ncbi:MAG: hypothetical protein E6J18_10375 [Chloroflexi bacterium]|nr:MAG: hypothetical protein E6J18_10375 [Chloroflexota bacterium]